MRCDDAKKEKIENGCVIRMVICWHGYKGKETGASCHTFYFSLYFFE